MENWNGKLKNNFLIRNELSAISRRCRVRKFCMVGEGTNHNDHDFPNRNAKLVPGGYQERRLLSRARTESPRSRRKPKYLQKHKRSMSAPPHTKLFDKKHLINVDSLGRSKLIWPRSGHLNIQLYPSRSIESTSVLHTNYLLRYISHLRNMRPAVYNVVAIADGGPDWSVKGVINLM